MVGLNPGDRPSEFTGPPLRGKDLDVLHASLVLDGLASEGDIRTGFILIGEHGQKCPSDHQHARDYND
jgi:hypothetical protein